MASKRPPRPRAAGPSSERTAPKRTPHAPRTAGQRAGVTRDAVLAAAHGLVEREGLEQVTMRRLAGELGVAPNALYTYFPNKTAIFDALLDVVLADVRVHGVDEGPWREGLADVMRASRRAMLTHPRLVPLFIARPGGMNALRLGETMLRLLGRGGVRGRAAVEALRALLVYTMGFVAVEVPRASDPDGDERLARAAARIDDLPAAEFRATRAAGRYLATHPGDRDFETGLRWLIAGIAAGATS